MEKLLLNQKNINKWHFRIIEYQSMKQKEVKYNNNTYKKKSAYISFKEENFQISAQILESIGFSFGTKTRAKIWINYPDFWAGLLYNI